MTMQIKRLVLLLLVGQIADCITTIIFVGRGNHLWMAP